MKTVRHGIEYVDPKTIKPDGKNARKHSKKQIKALTRSMKKFGFNVSILIDQNGNVIAGHARLEAALVLGMDSVPVIRIEHLTPAEVREFMIADNKIGDMSSFDLDLVCENFEMIHDLDPIVDLTYTGFAAHEIDNIIMSNASTNEVEEDIPAEINDEGSPVSQLGDLWTLGQHRVLCASSLEAESYDQVLGDEQAEICVTDPPYNVAIKGNVSGLGEKVHDEFQMASGEMSRKQFVDFLREFMMRVHERCHPGALVYAYMDWRHIHDLIGVGEDVFGELKQLCVWAKDNAGMGAFYRSSHELVCVFKKSGAEHINNFGLGQFGRYRTNVWEYAGMNSTSPTSRQLLKLHPTVKPVAMLADILLDASKPNGIVLDPFGGSGSTLIAAEHTNRRARLIELEPKYVDVIIQRWQAFTGKDAVLASTGETYNQRAAIATETNGE